jgi:hypothetical protein
LSTRKCGQPSYARTGADASTTVDNRDFAFDFAPQDSSILLAKYSESSLNLKSRITRIFLDLITTTMPPQFAILRVQKLKHLASVRRSLKHSFREQDTPNADPQKASQNDHMGATSVDQGMARVRALLPEKRRKDAVLAIEYLVTASPEAMHGKTREQQDAYFRDALQWLKDRHGAQNIVYAGIHRDELTPHLYAYAVPLDDASGRLNAKKWLGGSKALANMQTEFVEQVGAKHDLERGIEGSKAKHQKVKAFYAEIGKTTHHDAYMEETEAARDFALAEVKKLRNWREKFIDLMTPHEQALMVARIQKKKQAEATKDDGPSLG